ncbi:MAG TPA: hypothetical protein VLG92_01925 [Candidatus Saccharimonadia bacterium]|nr:hypothetical protein [Candidatus Saccharimonadia bacterium]
MSEQYTHIEGRPELAIIPEDRVQVSWRTNTEIPTPNIDEAWDWVSRMGLVGGEEVGGERGTGWGFPNSRWVPRTLRSPATLDGTRVLEAGARVRDAPRDSYAEVVEIDHDSRTILFKSDWPQKDPNAEPILYTYRITLEPGWGGTIMTTDMRATNVRHPRLMQMFGQPLDAQAMKMFGRGLTRHVDPEQAAIADRDRTRKHIGSAAAIGVGVTVWRLAKKKG